MSVIDFFLLRNCFSLNIIQTNLVKYISQLTRNLFDVKYNATEKQASWVSL